MSTMRYLPNTNNPTSTQNEKWAITGEVMPNEPNISINDILAGSPINLNITRHLLTPTQRALKPNIVQTRTHNKAWQCSHYSNAIKQHIIFMLCCARHKQAISYLIMVWVLYSPLLPIIPLAWWQVNRESWWPVHLLSDVPIIIAIAAVWELNALRNCPTVAASSSYHAHWSGSLSH